MVSLLSLVAPLGALCVGLILGLPFKFGQTKIKEKLVPLHLIVFGVVAGIALILVSIFLSGLVSSYLPLFTHFSALFQEFGITAADNTTELFGVVSLVGMLEVGLGSGFGITVKASEMQTKRKAKEIEEKTEATSNVTASTLTQVSTSETEVGIKTEEQGLRRDEQSVMELFLYGKVNQITPVVDISKPDGYFLDGIPQLDWDTKHSRQVMDGLVRKGYLHAELVDKLITCKVCGSANVRVRKNCPECGSLRLSKEALIEHFSCGAVERQSAFESQNGDFVCPKCKSKLQLIGSDYRTLPPAYLCLGCNNLQSEPALTAKCGECGSTAAIDDDPEVFLFKYSANSTYPLQELQQIKPLDTCTNFFKKLGYSIVAPAFVSGKSGTQHLFDILILGRVGWLEEQGKAKPVRTDNGNTAIEVLISSKPVDLEDITRIYGKISDIDCDFLLFVIPGLTANARNYAAAYGMKVSEGRNIEEALASSRIPQAIVMPR